MKDVLIPTECALLSVSEKKKSLQREKLDKSC